MGDIVLAGATSGTITLQPTAVAGSSTLTLPAANATVITTASGGQVIPKAALPTGSVLQVVSTGTVGTTSTTGNFPQNSGITLAITPSSTSSKILVITSIQGYVVGDGTNTNRIAIYGIKNNTSGNTLQIQRTGASSQATSMDFFSCVSFVCLDSPSSTSAQTYEILYGRFDGTYNNSVQINGGFSNTRTTITLMEIAA